MKKDYSLLSTEELIQEHRTLKKERLKQVYYIKHILQDDLDKIKYLLELRRDLNIKQCRDLEEIRECSVGEIHSHVLYLN